MTPPGTTDFISPKLSPLKRDNWRYLCGAMEMALSLGDIQKDSGNVYTPDEFCEIALTSINSIIQFDASAIYVVESENSDLTLSALNPPEKQGAIEKEMDFLIDQGFIAWGIREKRGISIFSHDGSRQLFLHVIATYSRIRGFFLGIFPSQIARTQDGANEFLSLLLRGVATSLESIEYATLLNQKNDVLRKEIDEKVEMILHKERELASTRKLNAVASLAGGIAHEFNNALTSLVGYNDLAKLDCADSSKIIQYTKKSSPLLDRLVSLTKQLLNYSQGGRYKTENVLLNTLIQESLSSMSNKFNDSVNISVDLEDTKIAINCDVKQIQEAMRSIMINAVEAITGKGNILIAARKIDLKYDSRKELSKLMPGEYVELKIKDDGIGMDQQTRERIYEPFFSTKFAGRGLGMAAVYGIIENHQGAIRVSSKPEKGTTVKIYLPVS